MSTNYTPNDRSQIATPHQQQYFDPQDVSQAVHGGNALIFGGLGAWAGRNAYQRGASLGQAALHGVYCAMRWKIWAMTIVVWVVWGTWMAINSTTLGDRFLFWEAPAEWNGYVGSMQETGANNIFRDFIMMRPYDLTTPKLLWCLNMVVGLFAVGLTYNRNIQECFFQRRLLYKVLAPIERATHWIPWWVLHSLIMISPMLPLIMYNQMHVIPEGFLDRTAAVLY